ncbi:hypothetical protein MKW98_001592 [Papaver atlanticum]|uniref:Uncharacterized protein n=1 Tax=Papaver atlanticum TaxID=357466 RepID=A0AAD4SAI1_9MAGN|nr:hypothetical protein MKW98_001592 [Papaver atlanticum]
MGGSASVSRTTKEVSCDEVMKDNLVSDNPEAESRSCILTPTLPQVRVIHYTGCRNGHKVVRASQSHKPVRASQTMKPVKASQSHKPDCASAEPWDLCESKNTVQKYWIDENSGCNCFMLFPRNLAIIWAENKQYWNWPSMKFGEMAIEVAELVNVCWLEVNGKFDTRKLSPGVKYEILFVVMLKNSACGWGTPVNLRLVHPCGKTQHRKENLQLKPKSQWIELQVGEFQTSPQLSDCEKEIQFSLFECENGNWKGGLVIKGVIIRPKKY